MKNILILPYSTPKYHLSLCCNTFFLNFTLIFTKVKQREMSKIIIDFIHESKQKERLLTFTMAVTSLIESFGGYKKFLSLKFTPRRHFSKKVFMWER